MTVRSQHTSYLAFVLSVFGALSCSSHQSQPAQAPAAEHDAVKAVVAGIIRADNEGDLESVMSFYEDDAVLLPPGEEPIYGKRLIRPRYQSLFDASDLNLFSTSEETIVSGDWACDRGYTEGTIVPQGKGLDQSRIVDDQYLMILHRQPVGSWKIARLMWHPKHHEPAIQVNKK